MVAAQDVDQNVDASKAFADQTMRLGVGRGVTRATITLKAADVAEAVLHLVSRGMEMGAERGVAGNRRW